MSLFSKFLPYCIQPVSTSVRISSKKTYNGGLFIADFFAMPHGCSVWPAYWSVGPNWPSAGTFHCLYHIVCSSFFFLQGKSTSWKASTINRPISIPFIPRKAAKLGRISKKRVRHPISSIPNAQAAEAITVVVAFSTPTPRPTERSSTCLLAESLPICGIALGSEYGAFSDLQFLQISQRRRPILPPGVLLPPSSHPPTVILLLISLNTLSC